MRSRTKVRIGNPLKLWVVLGVVVLVVGSGLGVAVAKPNALHVQKIECFTQFGTCQSELVNRAEFLVGRPIYLPLPRQQLAQQFSGLPAVSQVTAYRRLPSTVVLGITLRRPIAVVLGASSERAVVDEQGVVFEAIDRSALPTIKLEGDVWVGSNLSANQLQAAQLLAKVASIVATPVSASLSDNILTVTTSTGTTILVSVNNHPSNWDASLQSIWARSKIDGKFMRKIDLRFNVPAVSF